MIARVFAGCLCLTVSVALAAEWNQWRGPNRDGAAVVSPPLKSAIPDEGLEPVWVSDEIPSARNGGWGSPVVAGGKVYLYAHTNEQLREPGPRKFPWLAPDKRTGMTAEEYEDYERNRRDEDEERSRAFRYREFVYCLDAETGQSLWKNGRDAVYSRFPQSVTPAVIDGRLYVLGAARHARCVDAETGQDLWTTRLPGEFRDEHMQSCFAVADGAAVVLCTRLFGLDASTGELLWEGDPQKTRGTHSSPAVWQADGREYVIVNVGGRETACVEPRTGRELWRLESHANLSTPVVVGNLLITYGDSRQKGLRCFTLSPEGAEPKWTFQGAADKGSSPVVVDGHVYVQGEKRLACVNLETGRPAWGTMLDLANPQYTSLIAADGKVFYGHGGIICFAASPERYQPLIEAKIDGEGLLAGEDHFRELLGLDALERQPDGLEQSQRLYQQRVGRHGPLPCATPAIADGRLIVRLKNALACYDLRAE